MARLQELAQRQLPEVDGLIRHAELVRAWLRTATSCGCDTFYACALFSDASRGLDGLNGARPARSG